MWRLLRMVSPGMLPAPRAGTAICVDAGRAATFGFPPDASGRLGHPAAEQPPAMGDWVTRSGSR